MEIALEPFIKEYEALSKAADAIFKKVKSEHQDCVKCKIGCTECCYALFDISLIEAIIINRRFNEMLDDGKKTEILEKANRIDRKTHKLKREALKAYDNGTSENDILVALAKQKMRCPLLNDQDQCDLYSSRPITCRLYGIPTEIGGSGRTCGKTGFEEGKPYPTVHLDKIHQKLYDISSRFAGSINSRYAKLAELLVPLSMALLTEFDGEYLGIDQDGEENSERDVKDDKSDG
jgi:Fe-S-cluster containining protein